MICVPAAAAKNTRNAVGSKSFSGFDIGCQARLDEHIKLLYACRRCLHMNPQVVSGGAVMSRIVLVGQAPGDKEPKLGRPFAWTAGKTLFRWFYDAAGITEELFRSSVYMAAVCRCFPGKKLSGGDRVPSSEEIAHCLPWLDREIEILKPGLVIPVGRLAIGQFLPENRMTDIIGRQFCVARAGVHFDVIPLPHPSGASPWHRKEPGISLLRAAMRLIVHHPVFLARL